MELNHCVEEDMSERDGIDLVDTTSADTKKLRQLQTKSFDILWCCQIERVYKIHFSFLRQYVISAILFPPLWFCHFLFEMKITKKIDIYDKYIHIYQYGLLVCFDMCKYRIDSLWLWVSLRVTENRCVLFNSLTYVHIHIYALSTLCQGRFYPHIHLHMYIYE